MHVELRQTGFLLLLLLLLLQLQLLLPLQMLRLWLRNVSHRRADYCP
jgi:hypothetical protein